MRSREWNEITLTAMSNALEQRSGEPKDQKNDLVKLEINSENSILVNIPQGKSYISKPTEHLPQSAQKEGTCWYYTLNYLRPRYGKAIDQLESIIEGHPELKELSHDPDYLSLRKHRNIEKIISSYRKELTKLAEQKPADNRKEKLQLHHNLILALHGSDYKEKCDQKIDKWVQIVKQITQLFSQTPSKEDENTPDNRLTYVSGRTLNSAIFSCVEAYELKISDWKIKDGFKGLVETIRKYGALSANGRFGVNYYKRPPQFSDTKHGSFHVYYWQPNDRLENENHGGHTILIIGAEKIEDKEYIYYVDPNNPPSKHQKTVFKIPFNELKKEFFDHSELTPFHKYYEILLEINFFQNLHEGLKARIKDDLDHATYLTSANPELQIKSIEQYKCIIEKIKHISPAIYDKYFAAYPPKNSFSFKFFSKNQNGKPEDLLSQKKSTCVIS